MKETLTNPNMWTILTAVGTCLAAIVAASAYFESLKMRKNSAFNTLFAQLVENHNTIFSDKSLSAKFYHHFCKRLDNVWTMQDLCNVWNQFCNEIGVDETVKFSHAFKYVYHEAITILNDSTIDALTKRRYIGILQSLMNQDELFCYLINLLQHFEKYSDDGNDYREQLKQYNFFEDILREDDERYGDVMAHLCTSLYTDVKKIINL